MNILLVLFTSVYIESCFHSISSLVILTVCKTFYSKRIFLFCLTLLTPTPPAPAPLRLFDTQFVVYSEGFMLNFRMNVFPYKMFFNSF